MFGKSPGKRKINSKSTPASRRQMKKRLEQKKTQFADRTLVFTVYDDGSFDVYVQNNKKICLKNQYDRETAVGTLVLENPDFFKVKSVQKTGKKKKKKAQKSKQVNKPTKAKIPKKVKPKKLTKTEIAQKKREAEEAERWDLIGEVLDEFYYHSSQNWSDFYESYEAEDWDSDYNWRDQLKHREHQIKWYERVLREELEQAKLTKKNKRKYKTLAKCYAEMVHY